MWWAWRDPATPKPNMMRGFEELRNSGVAPIENAKDLGSSRGIASARDSSMRASPILLLLLAAASPCAAPGLCASPAATLGTPAVAAVAVVVGDGIVPDPQVKLGRLENGLRYAVRRQGNPRGRVSLCLRVGVGSCYERESESGSAHFVEHMAFAGTRDFPGDNAIRTLQRYGLGFGSGINGATGRSYTQYEIRNLPADDPEALATALLVLRNFADGVSFEPRAVERERGVILSEMRVRAGRIAYWWGRELEYLAPGAHATSDSELDAIFPDTDLSRTTIGSARSVGRATPERLKAFYTQWYRPDRMVLAVAGDVDPATATVQVARAFSGMQAGLQPEPAEPAVPAPRQSEEIVPVVQREPAASEAIVSLVSAIQRQTADSPERRRSELAETVAMLLLERRLGNALSVPAEIEAFCSHEVAGWTIPVLRLRTSPADWDAAAVSLDKEIRRAIQHGFSSEELEAAVEILRRKQRWAERDAPNRPGLEVAIALAHAVGTDVVFPSATAESAWLEASLDRLTEPECRAAAERLWPVSRRLAVTGPVPEWGDSVQRVRRGMKATRKAPLATYTPIATAEGLLPESFGTPGAVAGQEYDAAKDCWLVQFDNGVKLNFKATPFEQGRVRLRIGFGYGLLGTEPGREGLVFGIAALCYGNAANLGGAQERELLTRTGITSSFGFGADRFGLSANCPTGSFTTALRLFAARLVSPGDARAGEARTRTFVEEQLTRFDRTSPGVAEDRLREYLFGGHHALTRPRRPDTAKLTYMDMWRWIDPQRLGSPLEITVVGDIGLDEVVAEVSRTFGALPLRSTVDPLADRRLFVPGATPQRLDVRFQGKREVGSVALAWRLYDVVGPDDDCRMSLLGGVLEDRIRVRLRQEMGKAYTPVVGLMAERALAPALLFLRCRIETAPRQIDRVSEAAKAVVDDLVRNGISDDELERARLPLVRQAEENATSNAWWVFALDSAQSQPQFFEGQGRQREIYTSITRAELESLARLLFATDQMCEVRALPE